MRWLTCLGALVSGLFGVAAAEVRVATPEHFALSIDGYSEAAPDEVWARLIDPSQWWSDDHTYSGDADNLSLDITPGGMWAEEWPGGAVVHGTVMLARNAEILRLDAPFGPLQGLAVNVVWTISLTPEGTGTRVSFEVMANGSAQNDLDLFAPAVDRVKTEAMVRLVAP